MDEPVVWYMTTGQAGFRTQARGLASRLSAQPRELVVDLTWPWRRLPASFNVLGLGGVSKAHERPEPPWPDVLISCSRRAAAVAVAVRKAARGKTLAVHVQDPLTRASAFDLIVAMAHDRITGPNVIKTPTALHDVTPERLADAGAFWRGRLGEGVRPLVGVILGGPNKHQPMSDGDVAPLLDGLDAIRRQTGARLAVTPSRRTPDEVKAAFAARFDGDDGVFLWDMQGDNPYLGILALADRLVVTSDSVSMISEALATSAPVEVFGAGGGERHDRFLGTLLDQGLVRRFAGDVVAGGERAPFDATETAAEAVRRLLEMRGF